MLVMGDMAGCVAHSRPANKNNSNSNDSTREPQGLRADTLYTTSPDAVQRMHPHLQLRSGKAYTDPVTYDHPWYSMRDFARLLALCYEAVRTRHSYANTLSTQTA